MKKTAGPVPPLREARRRRGTQSVYPQMSQMTQMLDGRLRCGIPPFPYPTYHDPHSHSSASSATSVDELHFPTQHTTIRICIHPRHLRHLRTNCISLSDIPPSALAFICVICDICGRIAFPHPTYHDPHLHSSASSATSADELHFPIRHTTIRTRIHLRDLRHLRTNCISFPACGRICLSLPRYDRRLLKADPQSRCCARSRR